MCDLNELVKICRGRDIYIQTHNFPDADAISTAFALHELFAHFGIKSSMCCNGLIDRLSTGRLLGMTGLKFYSEEQLDGVMNEDDYIVCVDSQKHGGNISDFIGNEIACIDHHPTYKEVEYMWKQIDKVGACATLMTEHFQSLGIQPSKKCATALLYGIKMDTMHFTRGVTERDIDAFKYLFNLADEEELRMLETNNLESNDLKAYGSAIKHVQIYDRVGVSKISFPCPDALIASLSDFILSLDEVDVAIIYSKRKEGLKFSIRSMIKKVDAGKLANITLSSIGNGGGHASMAGGFIPNTSVKSLGAYPDEVIVEMFLSNIRDEMKEVL